MEFDEKIFPKRLEELRLEKGLSQYKLAKNLGIATSAIQDWESLKRRAGAENLFKLSKYFGVSIDYLVGARDE